MRKLKLLTLVVVLVMLLPSVLATTIEYSIDNISWTEITNVDETNMSGYQANLHPATKYFFRGKAPKKSYTYLSATTKSGGENLMASLAITIFILTIAGAFFALPFIKPELAENKFLNVILKRCSWAVGIFFMTFNGAIMATISDNAGLGVNQEMFRYMWVLGRAGWIFLLFLFFKTILDVMKMWKIEKEERRMGDG